MTKKERLQIRKRMISDSLGTRSLRRSARKASLNAQRASRVLNIPYTIIQNGIIYEVYDHKKTEIGKVDKINLETRGLKRGSKLCL